MDFLVVNGDGPDAVGLAVLRDVFKLHTRGGERFVTLTTREKAHGAGMSLKLGPRALLGMTREQLEEVEPDYYVVPGASPVDLVLLAFLRKDLFLPGNTPWMGVLCGVNHGLNLGMDIFHSGTVSQALVATHWFGAPAVAFSQDVGCGPDEGLHNVDRTAFRAAEKILPDYLRTTMFVPGECWNVNFPKDAARGYGTAPVAHYSYYLTPPTDVVPRAREEENDISAFRSGLVSISRLILRVNPPLRF